MNADWYLAAEGVFASALLLILAALIIETLFACCHCWLQRRSCAASTVASLTIAAGITSFVSLCFHVSLI